MSMRTKLQPGPWYHKVFSFLLGFGLLLVLIPVAILLLAIFGLPWLVRRYYLLLRVRREWIPKGQYVLFVYSDEPLWKSYVESHIIPKIFSYAGILNFSQRNSWLGKDELGVRLFRHYTWGREWLWKMRRRVGGHEFNHMAIVFKPWYWPKRFDFWKACKDHEFGKSVGLQELEHKFFNVINNS